MVLRFKKLKRKKNQHPDQYGLEIDLPYEFVNHRRQRFLQIKTLLPGQLEKLREFFNEFIDAGDFVYTGRYIYIPTDCIYADRIEETFDEEEDDDDY